VIGERRNGLVILLAALTARLDSPVSVLVKGPTSSGKSNLVRTVLRLLPERVVEERTSLSEKALAHGKVNLRGKVLYLTEQRAGKEAQMQLRLLQSEGAVTHEFTTIQDRSTALASRKGSPVVITTTTEDEIFEDDETRFLSLWVDASPKQTQAILLSSVRKLNPSDKKSLEVFKRAIQILFESKVTYEIPPWFETVARHVPFQVRSRRDWPRFLALCKALTLCRLHSTGRGGRSRVEIDFSDYTTAYRLLNKAFSETASTAPSQMNDLVKAVGRVYRTSGRPVSVNEIVEQLKWERAVVYKRAKSAVEEGLVKQDSKIRRNNEKRFIPNLAAGSNDDFLLSPTTVLNHHPELKGCKYVDPITGEKREIGRRTR